jgi:hypothetical protein
MGWALRLLAAAALGIVLGLGYTWLSLRDFAGDQSVHNGPWDTDPRIGSSASGLLLRAQVAIGGLLALNRAETIYYTASRDSSGALLDGACSYRIEGRDMDARWWSITSYASDHFLIPNAEERYSISKTSVQRGPDGGFVARASLTPEPVNWLPTAPGGFTLTLRLYNPAPAVQDALATTPLPSLVKEACQ